MKKIYSTLFMIMTAGAVLTATAQQQPNNPGFENWDGNGEPTNWNNMTTGNLCGLCALGSSMRVFQDNADYHSGAASARIEATSAIGNLVNGAITTGKVNAPSTTPSQGYNATVMSDANFNHPFTDMPDSVAFWAKYNITNNTDSARFSMVLHDAYDLRDPQDANSTPHVVATARKNFQTGGVWTRIAVPVSYTGPSANGIAYALMTFTSNYQAGAGVNTAKVWVDDLEFIYNPEEPNAIQELEETIAVYPNPSNDGRVNISLGSEVKNVSATVYNAMGQNVGVFNFLNASNLQVEVGQPAGLYFINITTAEGKSTTVRVIKG
jgi:hypothetical protein